MEILKYALTAFFYLVFLSISYGQELDKLIIVIDPGHGGIDTGAIGLNGVAEKNIVLSIATKLDSLNTKFYKDHFEIYLTRYRDTLISLRDRTRLAKRLKAAAFISFHCNQAANKRARGTEVYVDEKQKLYTQSSIQLASFIQGELHDMLGFKSRGVKPANFLVLKGTTNSCPSVLLELGFLSAIEEAQYLTNEEKHNGIALAILEAIVKNR